MEAKKGTNWFFVSAIVGVVLFFVYFNYYRPVVMRKQVLSAGAVPTHSAGQNLYPNPTFTPGDVFPDVPLSTVCTSGYTKSVRNVSVATKRDVYAEYGITYPQPRGAYEVDHFIPLEIGGSNDIKNLWPEPANPTPGFHEKDVVENYLHEQVCKRVESLSDAQKEITTDWYVVYQRIPNPQDYEQRQ